MEQRDRVLVGGGGISGVSCARVLAQHGIPVVIAERAKRIGGRMASRSYDQRPVDIGASYFTVSDPRFQSVVDDWAARGLARPWTDAFEATDGPGKPLTRSSGPMRWAAGQGLGSLVEDLVRGLDVEHRAIAQVAAPGGVLQADGEPAAAVVLAMPDPQAVGLLHPDLALDAAALDHSFDPVLALTASWQVRDWAQLDGVFVNDDPALSFIADDGRRRGDGAAVLVAHSTPAFAETHNFAADGFAEAGQQMLAAVRSVLAIDTAPQWTSVHRWSVAKPVGTRSARHRLSPAGLGFCGDSWSDRPRVEAAYLSGLELGQALATRFGR